ncbi:ABC transporter transmembrane domain-containing protein, partial [Bacillus sp. JJ722]|uniref:ABC transporter transmembrane domain-containing protein n=1 Tax=Bacillus sp. JJ722 TaxID=3122973 RepID=UPI00300042BB
MSKEKENKSHGGFGPRGGMGAPVAKAKDFKGTLKRLLRYLKPHKYRLLTVFLTAILSTLFTILGPKILGMATTKIFEGVSQKFAGIPGAGIDFGYLTNILLLLGGLYLLSSLFGFIQQYVMAGVAQKTVYKLRQEADDKISRLPLKYFDGTTHGETLSRVVNDMDNISTTLQQSLTQVITSIVTIIGVIIMMLTI